MFSPAENSRIPKLFKAVELFSSTFQGIFNFSSTLKKALYVQVLLSMCEPLVYLGHNGVPHYGKKISLAGPNAFESLIMFLGMVVWLSRRRSTRLA